jgi:hypothetical protein
MNSPDEILAVILGGGEGNAFTHLLNNVPNPHPADKNKVSSTIRN